MENQTKTTSRYTIILTFLTGSMGFFVLCILCGLLNTFCDMLLPQIIRFCVDCVIGGAAPETTPLRMLYYICHGQSTPLMCAMLVLATALLGSAFCYGSFLFNGLAVETLVKTMRDRLFSHVLSLPQSWHMKNATGDIIQRCTSDVEIIKEFFQRHFISLFRAVTLIIITMICMLRLCLPLSFIVILFLPVIIGYSVAFHQRIRSEFQVCDENEGVLSTIAQENLTGVRVVRAFGREEYERDRFEAQNQVYTNTWVKLCHSLSLFWSVGDLVSGLLVMLVLVAGTVLCVKGRLTAGEFIAFISYNTMLMFPVRRMGRTIAEMSKAGVSLDRIRYILESPPETDVPGAVPSELTGDIVFEHVSFRYGEGENVLQDLSFTIPEGCTLGILGATGSGKSTLAGLLCRFYEPTEGRILIGGQELGHIRLADVRKHVGLLLQEPFLFSRTIRENIGLNGASPEEIKRNAALANVDRDIEAFESGYETTVGERGVTLSGGQKQRIAIARMLTAKPNILIFDDSLSAVDTITDEKIRLALEAENTRRTSIIISHRITTLSRCERILVIHKGSLAEYGTPEELYEKGGIYRRICELQGSICEEEAV